MVPRSKADVIITVDPLACAILDCVEALLEYSGDNLGRLILIDDCCLTTSLVESFEDLADRDMRVRFVRHSARLGATRAYNHVLADCEGDAVLLSEDCVVSEYWLSELAAVAHSEERTACASPLMNGAGICSVAELNRELNPDETTAVRIRAACAGLPRWTVAPLLNASCIYLRRDVLDAVGMLSPDFRSACAAINNWVSRSQSLGFVAKRANHVFVHRVNAGVPQTGVTASPDREPTQLGPSEAHIELQVKKFCKSLDGHLPAHAIGMGLGGKLRVGFDIRHLPREQVGTRTYAVCLANALAELPEIDLTLLVRHPDQAKGLNGRVVTPNQWADDVAVLHRPAQVIDAGDLQLLFESSAHIIITYQDLIGYRIPVTFSSDLEFDRYRATSSLSLQAVQRIIAYSESAGQEISAEFGIPNEEISVIPLGVETEWFARREPFDETIRQQLELPTRYFFSLATDFPHKNLPNLLDAYSIFRGRWRGSKPPGLVLAGHTSCARSGFYPNLESKPLAEGITFLGPVTSVQLKVLYQNAEALVFPSLYEGFGLPPLEAMAAGTPVIAMPISAVPEVGGDSVLYPESLSAVDLARAMETVATNEYLCNDLRERGIRRAEQFRWKNTACATLEVYRAAVMTPTPRSLQMRNCLREGISRWSMHASHELMPQLMGILNVCRGFGLAFNMRLRRKLRMLPSQQRTQFRLKQTANAGFPVRPSSRRGVESSRQLS